MEQLYADIPQDLREADQLLTDYGRWSVTRGGKRTCGSAEGQYAIPPNDDNRRPQEPRMQTLDAVRVQRALSHVPERERIVLAILYIPHRMHPAKALRLKNIPHVMARECHLNGLRMFWNQLKKASKGLTDTCVCV